MSNELKVLQIAKICCESIQTGFVMLLKTKPIEIDAIDSD